MITQDERDRLVELARMARDDVGARAWYDFVGYADLLVTDEEATPEPAPCAADVVAALDRQLSDIENTLTTEKNIAAATVSALTGAIALLASIDPHAGGDAA